MNLNYEILLFIYEMSKKTFKKLLDARNAKKENELLIAQDVTNDGIKQYRLFSSYDELEKEMKDRIKSGKDNHFYEIINFPCHFFVDIDLDEELDVEDALDEIRDFFKDEKMYVYTSGSKSYHLLFPNVIVKTRDDAREKCEEMVSHMKSKIKDYVDHSVYRNNGLFRMLGSSKKGKRKNKVVKDAPSDLKSSLVNI